MELDLKSKNAVITGGTRGIGLAIAEGLAREGVNLAICARDKKVLDEAIVSIKNKYNVKAIGIVADVAKTKDIENFVSKVQEFYGSIDILINNAGMGSRERIMEASDEKWQYYWDLHVMAAVRLSRTIVPLMKERKGGVIINVSSVAAKQPQWYEPIYNVTKIALVMLSNCLAKELVTENIRVNCVNPGYILTPDWKRIAEILGKETGITWEDYINGIAEKDIPLGRFASVEEVADFIVFLCSKRASYCVGSTYYIDGGALKVVT